MRMAVLDRYGNTRYRTCRKGKRKTSYYHWCFKNIWLKDTDGGTVFKWVHTTRTEEQKKALDKFADDIVGLTVMATLCKASPEFAGMVRAVYRS